jgi:hypothetical protein
LKHWFGVFFFLLFTATAFGQSYTFKGKVLEQGNNQAIPDVSIAEKGSNNAVQSDINGYFEIQTQDPQAIFVFTIIGYQSENIRVKFGETTLVEQEVQLKRKNINYSTVEVTDKRSRVDGAQRIEVKSIVNLPNTSGSFESILKTLPGVISNNELSSQYAVRGGNFDENLVYINDIELIRPQLVRNGQQEGLSLINGDMVSNVKFYAGGFDARYGDKLSSALDIYYRKPNTFGLNLQAGLLANSITIEGSSPNRRFTYLTGFRQKTNRNLLAAQDTRGEYQPQFIDFQNNFTFDITEKIEFSVLAGVNLNRFNFVPQDRSTTFGTFGQALRLDVFFEGQEIDLFNTAMANASLTLKPNNKIRIKLIQSYFDIDEEERYDIEGSYIFSEVESDFGKANFGKIKANRGIGSYYNHGRNYLNSNFHNSSFKSTFDLDKHVLNIGGNFQYQSTQNTQNEWRVIDSAGFSIPNTGNEVQVYELFRSQYNLSVNRWSVYAQDNISLSDSGIFFLTLGTRLSGWDFSNNTLLSPRASFAFKPKNSKRDILYRISSGIYNQYPFVREFKNYNGVFQSSIKAQQSIHYTVGADYNFKALKDRQFTLRAEAYYKQLKNIIPYETDNVRIRYYGNNDAKGYAAGMDFRLNGEFVKGLDSWFSLSFLKTEEDILGDTFRVATPDTTFNVIEPGYIPRPGDQRVNFSIFFQDELPNNPSFKVHLNLVYGSGLPFGPPDNTRYKDTLRIPAYQRVDIGFSKTFIDENNRKTSGILKNVKSLQLYAEIFNLLQKKNTISYLWIRDVTDAQYAIPNYLTNRLLNIRLIARF